MGSVVARLGTLASRQTLKMLRDECSVEPMFVVLSCDRKGSKRVFDDIHVQRQLENRSTRPVFKWIGLNCNLQRVQLKLSHCPDLSNLVLFSWVVLGVN